jgi:surface protein
MRRPTRSNKRRVALLSSGVVATMLLWLPGTGSFAAWEAGMPLEGTLSTGNLDIVPSTISGGVWNKDGSYFDPWTERVTAGTTLVNTSWNVPVSALGDNLTASFSPDVTGAVMPASVADHVSLSVATDPATIQGATSEGSAQRSVALRLTLTADEDLPLAKETIDLSHLTVTFGNGHGWTDTATLNAGTLTTSDGRPAGGTVQLSYDLAYDDDDVVGFYLDDPAPGTTVEWDVYDGSQQVITDAQDGLNEFDFSDRGNAKPTIRVKGSFDGLGSPEQTAEDIGALTHVMGWTNGIGTTSAAYAFANATHLTHVGAVPRTVQDATAMFQNAGTGADSLYVGWGDTSNVTSMAHMFDGATSFNQQNISWDTSKVADMSFMFKGATSFAGPIRFSTTANVTTMEGMFQGATSYTGGAWDGGAVIQFWDTSRVTSMASMFDGATSFDRDLRMWDTSSVTNMSSMFRNATAFNFNSAHSDAEVATDNHWDTSSVTSMASMFQGASAFNRDIGTWNTSRVTSFSNMFSGAGAFNRDIGAWDTSAAKNMSNMFRDAVVFNQDVSGWHTTNVQNMSNMFKSASVFSQDLSGWDVAKVTNHTDFGTGSALTGDQLPVWASLRAAPAPTAPAGEPAPASSDTPAVADDATTEGTTADDATEETTSDAVEPEVTEPETDESTDTGTTEDGVDDTATGADGDTTDADGTEDATDTETPAPEPVDPDEAIDALEEAWKAVRENDTDETRQALEDAATVVDDLLGDGASDEILQELEDEAAEDEAAEDEAAEAEAAEGVDPTAPPMATSGAEQAH